MSEDPGAVEGAHGEIPDAVRDWLRSIAAEQDVSEAELLRRLLEGGAGDAAVERPELDRLEEEFRSLLEDVRERVIQVKREADAKAPAGHAHPDLSSSIEQLGREVGTLEVEVDRLDERLARGFDNYEEIVTYLTDTTDEVNRRLARVASAVVDLRERVGDAVRAEARRTALTHLAETANRHGIETAKCRNCDGTVDISLLLAPRCPHCDSPFSSLEPKRGFFRTSVLHTGAVPALESAPEAAEATAAGLESLVDQSEGAVGGSPAVAADEPAEPAEDDEPAEPVEDDEPAEPVEDDELAEPVEDDGAGGKADGSAGLQSIDGIGPAYADRLEEVGIGGVAALAAADPEAVGSAIDVPASRVANWVDQAGARATES